MVEGAVGEERVNMDGAVVLSMSGPMLGYTIHITKMIFPHLL